MHCTKYTAKIIKTNMWGGAACLLHEPRAILDFSSPDGDHPGQVLTGVHGGIGFRQFDHILVPLKRNFRAARRNPRRTTLGPGALLVFGVSPTLLLKLVILKLVKQPLVTTILQRNYFKLVKLERFAFKFDSIYKRNQWFPKKTSNKSVRIVISIFKVLFLGIMSK